MGKYVYLFNEENLKSESSSTNNISLSEMIRLGLPIPPGMIIKPRVYEGYYQNSGKISEEIIKEIFEGITRLENKTNKTFGSEETPLLLSVRNSPIIKKANAVLNIGINDKIAASIAKDEESARFIYDSYRILIITFANVVKGKDKETFEDIVRKTCQERDVKDSINLSAEDIYNIVLEMKKEYYKLTGEKFPENPKEQLLEVIKANLNRWDRDEKTEAGINIQEMIYGNLSDTSLTGVIFTRNPLTGEDKICGKFLPKAQGEDITSNNRVLKNIDEMSKGLYYELNKYAKIIENNSKSIQKIEFTIQNSKVYILKIKKALATALATVNTIVDMVDEKLITKEEAIMKINMDDLNSLIYDTFKKSSLKNANILTRAISTSPGAVSGQICIDVDDAINKGKNNIKTILIKKELTPKDLEVMNYVEGILTIKEEVASHTAIIARGTGKCYISGCKDIIIDKNNKIVKIKNKIYEVGNYISLDGTTGNIYEGIIETESPKESNKFKKLLKWASELKTIKVRANADTPKDIKTAIKFGAEGIGLCRTEHMFFEKDRIISIRKLMFSEKQEDRNKVLKELLPIQTKEFEELFKAANGNKLTVRLLDPPLQEFLPKKEEEIIELSRSINQETKEIKRKIESLKENNPIMGLRGCRLAIIHPEIASMQAEALFKALVNVKKQGIEVKPEIMIPLVGDIKELKYLKEIINKIGNVILKGKNIEYKLGTMIEVPRSIILADKIAKNVDFFSFGTNDLTQMTYGFSRDNTKLINSYHEKNMLEFDPFKTIDQEGVGKLMTVAITLAKRTNKKIELGVCGEHSGDEKSIKFFDKIGMDYVSCSAYRVPVAILASAKAAIKN